MTASPRRRGFPRALIVSAGIERCLAFGFNRSAIPAPRNLVQHHLPRPASGVHLPQRAQKHFSIPVIVKERLAPVPAADEVIDGPGMLDSHPP